MKRSFLVHLFTVLVAVSLSSALAFAQSSGTKPSGSPGKPAANAQGAKREPCWQVAGISQSAMQQHKELEQSAHSQIQSVCADGSLSAQQKREKIKDIREQTRQKADALITPQQQEALKACRQERGEGKHMAGGHGGNKGMHRGQGPCGDMPMGAEKTPPSESKPQQ